MRHGGLRDDNGRRSLGWRWLRRRAVTDSAEDGKHDTLPPSAPKTIPAPPPLDHEMFDDDESSTEQRRKDVELAAAHCQGDRIP
jgi:hypothetical protein